MKSLIETLEDGTLVLTRRGLSVLSVCFFQISILHHNSSSNLNSNSSQTSIDSLSSYTNLNYDLCECMQILMQLCETVKHHLDKRTEGIKQIIQAWKEKNELCKRALLLVNFFNVSEVRSRALELVRMVLSVSPNETLQYVIQIVYNAYTANQAQVCMSHTASICNNNSSLAGGSACSQSAHSTAKQQGQCASTIQLVAQAVHLMGPHFPLHKKMNLNQSTANSR